MKESVLQSKIMKWLESQGAWVAKYPGGRYAKNGTPDILCCLDGRFYAFEVKVGNNKPSKIQEFQMQMIKAAGGVAAPVWSLEDVQGLTKADKGGIIPLNQKEKKKK